MKQKRRPVRLFASLMVFLLLFPLSACAGNVRHEAYVPLEYPLIQRYIEDGAVYIVADGKEMENEDAIYDDLPGMKFFSVGGKSCLAYRTEKNEYKSLFGDKTFSVYWGGGLHSFRDNEIDSEVEGPVTNEESMEIAKDFLAETIDVFPELYSSVSVREEGLDAYGYGNIIHFEGKVNGITTWVAVGVNKKGEVYFYSQSIGLDSLSYDDLQSIDHRKAKQAVIAIMDAKITALRDEGVAATYDEVKISHMLELTPSGQICLYASTKLHKHYYAASIQDSAEDFEFVIPL